jgi:hypothetical protein
MARMIVRCFVVGFFLVTSSLFGAETFVAFGLTNVILGNAIYRSNLWGTPFINVGTNGQDGVSVLLGEADSGVFVYPSTDSDPPRGSFMEGHIFGSINGETNRLICSMRAFELVDGTHPVEIDLSPLGSSHVTFQAFRGRQLVAQSGPQQGSMVVYGNYFTPYYPRVNPFWRMRDGSVGAVIEFDTPAPMNLPDIGEISAERVFIRADNPTNVVDFTSRLDITGGGPLGWFAIEDARPGVFGSAHKALGATLLDARAGTLTLSYPPTNAPAPAVLIEVDFAARFEATFVPLELNTNQSFTFTGVDVIEGQLLGSLRLARDETSLSITAQFGSDSLDVVVYENGLEKGRVAGTNATLGASARLIAAALSTPMAEGQPGLGFRFDQTVPITAGNVTYQGNEIRFLYRNPVHILTIAKVAFEAEGLASFTITDEQRLPWTQPRLEIVQVGTRVEISWTDANRVFTLEASPQVDCCFTIFGVTPTYNGNVATVILELDAEDPDALYFRLNSSPSGSGGSQD